MRLLISLLIFIFVSPLFAVEYDLETLTDQDDVIWGFDFLAPNTIIFTERDGKLKVLNTQSKKVKEVSGAPEVYTGSQAGLLDVRVDSENKNLIYLTYSKKMPDGKNTTALGAGTLKDNKLVGFKDLFVAKPANKNNIHYGSRIDFGKEGHIYMTIGDRRERNLAQDLNSHMGSVVRVKKDGSVPKDNPFVGDKNKLPEIWSYGHRSPQGITFRPNTDELWEAEMGPRGGDEINLIQKANNYGWPKATYGKEYWGPSIGDKKVKGMTQPVAYWVPSISPSAMHFYDGDKYPAWKGNLFLACLSGQQLRRIEMSGKKVVKQEALFAEKGLRFRNVRAGSDGYIYVSTDDGKIARIIEKKSEKKK